MLNNAKVGLFPETAKKKLIYLHFLSFYIIFAPENVQFILPGGDKTQI
jgi:hypothetical protein